MRKELLRNWGAAIAFAAAWIACWTLQLHAEVALDANAIDASPKLQWWAHTMENWQSEFLQLTAAALLVEAGRLAFFRRSADTDLRVEQLDEKVDELLVLANSAASREAGR